MATASTDAARGARPWWNEAAPINRCTAARRGRPRARSPWSLILLDKVADGDFDASSLITNETLVLSPSVSDVEAAVKALAADKSMVDRWKIISPGKKGKTKVTAEEGQPLVADAIARANESARTNHPPT